VGSAEQCHPFYTSMEHSTIKLKRLIKKLKNNKPPNQDSKTRLHSNAIYSVLGNVFPDYEKLYQIAKSAF